VEKKAEDDHVAFSFLGPKGSLANSVLLVASGLYLVFFLDLLSVCFLISGTLYLVLGLLPLVVEFILSLTVAEDSRCCSK